MRHCDFNWEATNRPLLKQVESWPLLALHFSLLNRALLRSRASSWAHCRVTLRTLAWKPHHRHLSQAPARAPPDHSPTTSKYPSGSQFVTVHRWAPSCQSYRSYRSQSHRMPYCWSVKSSLALLECSLAPSLGCFINSFACLSQERLMRWGLLSGQRRCNGFAFSLSWFSRCFGCTFFNSHYNYYVAYTKSYYESHLICT